MTKLTPMSLSIETTYRASSRTLSDTHHTATATPFTT
eukprot:CAMPEP_0173101834 /NCGR_PEP_ID=MMETSP1102-20130122/37127_1 /TAXON_ID=49646 /ORGANISM="Geminigera sp., Strain Caron Lab Isolate" /LENGTH=36 /DNA_ID= /DNA_START= /DNA_END= /DNA_ORIENTATION=